MKQHWHRHNYYLLVAAMRTPPYDCLCEWVCLCARERIKFLCCFITTEDWLDQTHDFPTCRLIEECWSENPADRPTFKDIIDRLLNIQNYIVRKRHWRVSFLNFYLMMHFFSFWSYYLAHKKQLLFSLWPPYLFYWLCQSAVSYQNTCSL